MTRWLLAHCTWSGGNSRGVPHPVGQLKPDPWGLYDINGNADEYCSDWFSTNYYASVAHSVMIDPRGPASGTERVVRGARLGNGPVPPFAVAAAARPTEICAMVFASCWR
ncbi:MAG TPA: SUMF1/EgtB/PvdO family nonheme iron enzyme [Verrucomicrobiae bacterium]|jgi:formylglycine-generating enzyme required for sulfatase activity